MEPFRASLAVLPLAIYLLQIGVINLRRRPFLTSGGRDWGALALAMSGFLFVGPFELFLPVGATVFFGAWVWALLAALYLLGVLLLTLISRPRLVVYNISVEELRPPLAHAVHRLDAESSWAGNAVWLPNLGVGLRVERFGAMRNASLVATSPEQNLNGWRQLDEALAEELAVLDVGPNPFGVTLLSLGLLMAGAVAYWIYRQPDAVLQGLQSWLLRS